MIRKAKILLKISRSYGIRAALDFSLNWLLAKTLAKSNRNYLTAQVFDPFASKPENTFFSEYSPTSPLVWYVPSWTNVWGGGHFTIFRFAHLISIHRENFVYVYNNEGRCSAEHFENSIKNAFPKSQLKVLIDPTLIPKDAIPMATTWQSAYSVLQHSYHSGIKFYFMQDYENLFYAHGTESMQALQSYKLGFVPITGGPWLLSKYHENSKSTHTGMNYMFAIDHSVFFPALVPRNDISRIFFYGRPSTERRCFELGISALKLIKDKYPKIEIVIAGLDGIKSVGFEATMIGSAELPKLGELYRSCDLGIALSATNLSYLPLELMACGVPVISNDGPQVEWFCENNVNSLVVPPYPSSIVNAVESLIADRALYEQLRDGGLEKVRQLSWESEANKISDFINRTIYS